MVVKEGYDEKVKKRTGWFGRSKKEKDEKSSTLSSSQYVSRPPTASSYARSRSTPTLDTTTDATATTVAGVAASTSPMNPLGEEDDEDLPPRLNSPILQDHDQIRASPPTSVNSAMSSGSNSRAPTPTGPHALAILPAPHTLPVPSTSGEDSDIPKCAGFDLDAMRKMIGQAVKEKPEELQVNPPAVMAESDYDEFGNTKSDLMPDLPSVVVEEEKSWLAKDVVKFIPLKEKEQVDRRYGGRREFSSLSPSLPYDSLTGNAFDSPTWGPSTSAYLPSSTYRSSPAVLPPPSSSSSSSPGFSSPSFAGGSLHYNPFATSSTTSDAFNKSDRHSQPYENHPHQFGASRGARLDSGTGLSFGSADGTIMSVMDGGGRSSGSSGSSSSSSRLDAAWVVPSDIGKPSGTSVTTLGFAMNPWA